MDKNQLRQYIRNEKRQHSQCELEALSLSVCRSLLADERLSAAHSVLLYHPLPDEVDVRMVIDTLYAKDIEVYLPKVVSDTEMTLHRYEGPASLQKGSFGILEPQTPACEPLPMIDVAVIPGMAFDAAGHRLGRGKGYYDRFLHSIPYLYKIGVCYPFQLVDNVPTDENDVKMDAVVC